jgi:hypothetical protein
MDFSLSPKQKLMCQAVREFMVGECKPDVTLELVKKKQFPWWTWSLPTGAKVKYPLGAIDVCLKPCRSLYDWGYSKNNLSLDIWKML